MANNSNNQKKYASLSTLQNFLSNLKNLFATKTDVNAELAKKADIGHTHTIANVTNLQTTLDGKVPTSRTVNGKALTSNITLSASDVGASATGHNHNYEYYTQSQVDTKLSGKSDTTHNHDAKYEAKNSVSTHNTSTTAHADIRDLITGLTTRLNTLANSDDTTLDQLSEIVAYIKNNKSLIDGITTNKVNVADIINNITTNVANKPLSAAQGVEIKRLIDALDSALDTHDANTTKHITSTERTNWNNAKTLAENALSTSGGTMTGAITATQINIIKRDVDNGGVTILGGTEFSNSASLGLYGKNQSAYPGYFRLTADDDNDIAILEGRPDGMLTWDSKTVLTATGGVLPVNNGGTGASTPSKALQNLGITATATDLNYMDGVTSNVQTQLDSLSSDLEDHTHSASDITSGTIDAARLPKASGTVAGIMSTGTQTIAGTKTFTSQIKPAGVLTSGHITASADSTYSIGSTTSAFNNAYINSLFINPERVNGSAIFGGSFEVEKTGTDTQVGIAKLKIGNPTKEGTAGNARGYIQIYNENNGSVTLETNHSDDYAFRVSLPTTTGRLVTNNEVYTKADQRWNLLYDSGEISAIANSISNIDVSGYTNIQVLVRCYNDGDSINSRAGSAIFTCKNGKTYQFPVWSNMFSKSINTVYTMATFNLVDGWLVCPYASRLIGDASTFEDEGGTAGNLSLTGSGMMKCTSQLSTLTISNLDQNSNYYFGMGSRVMVWGWRA
jgi:hypothetical protein